MSRVLVQSSVLNLKTLTSQSVEAVLKSQTLTRCLRSVGTGEFPCGGDISQGLSQTPTGASTCRERGQVVVEATCSSDRTVFRGGREVCGGWMGQRGDLEHFRKEFWNH